MISLVDLAKALIRIPSITPYDKGCQVILQEILSSAGFRCEAFTVDPVSNLLALYGQGSPLLVLSGHTDVVDPGDLNAWHTPPFEPCEKDGKLYGRGAQDMKGNLAAMVLAAVAFVQTNPHFKGTLALAITSAEEGSEDLKGTPKLLERLSLLPYPVDACLVGEPSSEKCLGDTLRVGRRGSLNGSISLYGKQGHAAYAEPQDNPIFRLAPFLAALAETSSKGLWDDPHVPSKLPPTQVHVTDLHAGYGAFNVVPGSLKLLLNSRFNDQHTAESLQQKIQTLLDTCLDSPNTYEISWRCTARPFFTQPGKLTAITLQMLEEQCGLKPTLSTAGGTSDARFFAESGIEVLELGCCHDSIHQINEGVVIEQLQKLCQGIQTLLERYFA